MASRGTPPTFPASGGAMGTSSVAIGDPDEDTSNPNLKCLTTKIASSMDFAQQSESILEFWKSVSKINGNVKNREHLRNNIRSGIRLHQVHVIDPRWCETPLDMKTNIYTALKVVENIVNEDAANLKEFGYLQATHYNAWKGKDVQPILSGKPDFKSTDYFHLECPEVCMKRLSVLVETRLDLMAFNLTEFLVKNLFDKIKRRNNVLLVKWLEAATSDIMNDIFDVYLTLIFKLKKDSILIYPTLKLLSIEDILSAIDRWSQRKNSSEKGEQTDLISNSDSFSKLWVKPMCSKVEQALCEYSMIYAAKCELKVEVIRVIVSKWLRLFPEENDSNLDVEVDKYVSLGGKTAQIYEIGYQIYAKYGDLRRQLYVEQFIRGLSYDLNVKEVALTKKDHPTLKQAEHSISSGLQYLAKVMHNHVVVVRECLLTAFSLTPTEQLLSELKEAAERSGLIRNPNESPDSIIDDRSEQTDLNFQRMDFDSEIDSFITSLEKGNYMRTSYSGRLKDKKKTRNLDALLSIQGDLITEAANYDPVAAPMPSFTAQKLNLHPRIVADLLICINSSRWHLLSWVMDWPSLEEKCRNLLANPEIRKQDSELKYLVIDYTQFDDWSSEDDIMDLQNNGIEKGYEEWDKYSSGDEQAIEERGLENCDDLDFNVMPRLLDQQGKEVEDDFFDDYIEPKDYLPKRFYATSEEKEISKGEKEKSVDQEIVTSIRSVVNSPNLEGTFLGKKEELTGSTIKSHVAECASSGNLLLSKNIEQEHVTAIDKSPTTSKEPIKQLICNRLEIKPQCSPLYLRKKEQVKWLQRIVPGLDGDLSFFNTKMEGNRKDKESTVDVFVVHVSTSHPKNSSTSISANPQVSAIMPTEAQGVKINGVSSPNISSPSSSNPTSPTKANGFSPTSSSGSESNAIKTIVTPTTKTSAKSKRRTVTSKTSPSASPSKVTLPLIRGDKQEPKDGSLEKPQITSNKPNQTVSEISNDALVGRQSNILTLQANSLTSQLNPQLVTQAAQQSSAQSRDQQPRERKVQYIYKQGGQTVIIDYPMTEDTLARLKPVPVIQQGQQQQQIRLPIVLANAAGGGSPQKIFAQRSSATPAGNQNNTAIVLPTTPPKIILSAAQSPSVDTLANSLISQIQTPVNPSGGLSPGNQSQAHRMSQQFSSSTTSSINSLPKFQFAFGGSRITRQVSANTTPVQHNPTSQTQTSIVKTENGNIVGTLNQQQNASNNSGQQLVMKQVTLPLTSVSHSQVLGAAGQVIQLQKSPNDLINGKIFLTQSSPQTQQIKQQAQSPQRCIIQSVPGAGGGVTITKPQPTQINAIIQKLTPVTTVQQQLAGRTRTSVSVLPQVTEPSVPVLSQGSITNSLHSASTPITTTSSISTPSNNQVDLIRQLNMARAQGLVILQQWGDKQVLVHKATGRWIMRQGNRLVTVPPQALGITPPTISPSGNLNSPQRQTTTVLTSGSPTKQQWIQTSVGTRAIPQSQGTPNILQTGIHSKPSSQLLARLTSGGAVGRQEPIQVNVSNLKSVMSSSTMEQLAEFDSILESKFKSLSPPPAIVTQDVNETTSIKSLTPIKIEGNNQTLGQSLSRTQSSSTSGPTFVILQPANTSTKPSNTSSSVVVTSASSTLLMPNKSQLTNKLNFEPYNNINVEKMSSASSTSSRGSSNRSPSPLPPSSSTKQSSNGIRILSTSAPSSPAKHTISTPPVALNQSCSSASASPASSTSSSSATSNFIKPPPKPQEDPDTLKRIQQILDDYNEQIRNSPDLQNRPAPRRRTNGVPSTTSSGNSFSSTVSNNTSSPVMSPVSTNAINGNPTSAKKKRNTAGSVLKSDLDTDSSSIPQISPANVVEPGQILGSQKVVSKIAPNDSQSTPVAPPPNLKPVVRQIMVPPSLAASLQASGRQLMVVTGPGGKKMVALKPLLLSQSNGGSTNNGSNPIRIQTPSLNTTKSSSIATSSFVVGPPGASVAIEADDYHHGHSPEEEEEGNGISVNLGRPSQSDSPGSAVSSQSIVLTSGSNHHSVTSGSPMSSNNQSLPASPLEDKVSEVMNLPSKLETDQPPTPPPISLGLEMPLDTQSMGIPIEMTAGQIMEAEMSASGSFLDDEVVSASTSINMNEFFTHNRHSPPHHVRSSRCSLGSDHEALSHAEQETLPENVFNHDFLSDGSPASPKLLDQHSMNKTGSIALLDDFEPDMDSTQQKIGSQFSLDGIDFSLADTHNAVNECLVANGPESKLKSSVSNKNFETEKEHAAENVTSNNNRTEEQQTCFTKSSTRQRKRNLSSTITSSSAKLNSSIATVSVTSSSKRIRLKKQNDDFKEQHYFPKNIITRQQRNSLIKNKSDEDDNVGAESNQEFNKDENGSPLLSESLENTSSVSFLTPFAGLTATASTGTSVGDFDL